MDISFRVSADRGGGVLGSGAGNPVRDARLVEQDGCAGEVLAAVGEFLVTILGLTELAQAADSASVSSIGGD